MAPGSRLLIGDVAALTGVSAGRIRYYEKIGLLQVDHLDSGYRVFAPEHVVALLRIDLLRSLGMGIPEIRGHLDDEPGSLRAALERRRAVLDAERQRIERVLASVDEAMADDPRDQQALISRLATSHRDSLGLMGRLSRPLSASATQAFADILGRWQLPVPPLFGQMLLPEPVTDFLEALARAEGHEELFARLHALEREVFALPADRPDRVQDLAEQWVTEQLATRLPEPLAAVLDRFVPRLARLPVFRHGFTAWAESFSPVAAGFVRAVEAEAERHDADVLGVIVVGPRTATTPDAASARG